MGSSVITQTADYARLREPTSEPKAHWSYDRDFVCRWAEELAFHGGEERWVAEADGEPVARAGLVPPAEDVAIPGDLRVDPASLRRGPGARLFRLAADRARELGAERLKRGVEPNALGFCEKMGGGFLHTHVTEWGREGSWCGMQL